MIGVTQTEFLLVYWVAAEFIYGQTVTCPVHLLLPDTDFINPIGG